MSDPLLNPKFLRGFAVAPGTVSNSNHYMQYFLRVVYEFWGFCVNGTDDLRRPGGFSTSHVTGSYLSMSVGWESGSSVLLASGSDGATFAGTKLFQASNSQPFSASYKGKHISIWKSGSTSTDDSIYPIVEWVNSSSIMIDPTYGGTSIGPSGSVPQMTTRDNINYRIVDFVSASRLPVPTVGFLVFQFNGAADVNPGQRLSQFKLSVRVDSSTWDGVRIQLSPSGSWDGTQFVGPFENSIDFIPDTGYAFNNFFQGSTAYPIRSITMIADKTFCIATVAGDFDPTFSYGDNSVIMVEIPKRLYPREMDPNPICGIAFANESVSVITSTRGSGYSSRWIPSPYDTTMRKYAGTMPCYTGWTWPPGYHSTYAPAALENRRYPVFYNPVNKTSYLPPTTMYLGYFYQAQDLAGQPSVQGKTSVGRVRLRSQKIVPGGYQRYARLDDGINRWIHIKNGVLWPWDHAIVATREIFKGA